MGVPLSTSAFNFSREVAFSSPTLACFLHVGQYISTFIARMIAPQKSYNLLPVFPDTARLIRSDMK